MDIIGWNAAISSCSKGGHVANETPRVRYVSTLSNDSYIFCNKLQDTGSSRCNVWSFCMQCMAHTRLTSSLAHRAQGFALTWSPSVARQHCDELRNKKDMTWKWHGNDMETLCKQLTMLTMLTLLTMSWNDMTTMTCGCLMDIRVAVRVMLKEISIFLRPGKYPCPPELRLGDD